MSNDTQEIILITRADDMGYTHTGNLATIECLRNGIIRSAAILAVAPWFEEAAKLAAGESRPLLWRAPGTDWGVARLPLAAGAALLCRPHAG